MSSKWRTKEQNLMTSEESKDKTTDVKNISVIIEIWKELLLATNAEMINLDTKQDSTIICLQEICFRFKDTTRLEAQGWKTVKTCKW